MLPSAAQCAQASRSVACASPPSASADSLASCPISCAQQNASVAAALPFLHRRAPAVQTPCVPVQQVQLARVPDLHYEGENGGKEFRIIIVGCVVFGDGMKEIFLGGEGKQRSAKPYIQQTTQHTEYTKQHTTHQTTHNTQHNTTHNAHNIHDTKQMLNKPKPSPRLHARRASLGQSRS